MAQISDHEETSFLTAIKHAIDLVDDGLSPNEALYKVAQEHQFSPGQLRAAVAAVNTGRQLAQWKANPDILDKLASFPLADYEQIAPRIWHASEKAACDDYSGKQPNWLSKMHRQPPAFVKAAEQQPPAKPSVKAIRIKLARDERRMAELCTEASGHRDSALVAYHGLREFFKRAASMFPEYEQALSVLFGNRGRLLSEKLAADMPKLPRLADGLRAASKPVSWDESPYAETQTYFDAADGFAKVAALTVKIGSDLLAMLPIEVPEPDFSKEGLDIMSPLKSTLGGALGGIGAVAATRHNSGVSSAMDTLNSPDLENKLRRIRIQAMLARFMNDRSPTNPVAGHDPYEVANAYNDLSQLAPRLAEQPAVMQGLLGQKLTGSFQPFEGGNMLAMERNMQQTRNPLTDLNLMNDGTQ